MNPKNKYLIIILFFGLFILSIPNVSAFLPLGGGISIIQQTTQGFCMINNQTTNIVRCGQSNTTLYITHGKGITVNMFPGNATMWINGTGSQGPIGPQGPTGATGPTGPQGVKGNAGTNGTNGSNGINGQVHAVTSGTGISVNGTTGTVQVSNSGVTSLGANSPVSVSSSTGAITISCTTCLTSAITSLNFTTNNDFDFHITPKNMTYLSLIGQVFSFGVKNNIVLTNESGQTITKSLTLNSAILGGNLNVGSNALTNLGHAITLPSNSGTICLTNQSGTCGSAFSDTDSFLTSINSQSGPTITILRTLGNTTVTNNTNSIVINTGYNIPTLTGLDIFTGNPVTINNLKLGGQMNIQANSFLVNTHTALFPQSTSGTICYSNQTTTCGAAPTDTDTFVSTSQNIGKGTGSLGFLSSPTSSIVKAKNATAGSNISIVGNTTDITFSVTGVPTLAGQNIFSGINQFASGNLLLENPAKTFDYAFTASAITANRTLNWPLITQTETIAVQPSLNSTQPSDPTGTTSTTGVMTGMLAGFTPHVTGRVQIIIEGDLSSLLSADGAKVDARYGTNPAPANAASLSGTVCGKIVQVTAVNSAANLIPFTLTCQVTGLAVGTHIWVELGEYAVSASTASVKNINVSIMEI